MERSDQVSSQVRDAVLIVNPTAGGGRRMRQLDEARRVLRNAGIETELQNTSAPGEATVMARRAVEAAVARARGENVSVPANRASGIGAPLGG